MVEQAVWLPCWSPTSCPVEGSTKHLIDEPENAEVLTELTNETMPACPKISAAVSFLYSSRPFATALVALSGLEELATEPTPRSRAPSVVFLFGGAQPWSCQAGELLFPAVRETGEGRVRPATVA